MKMERSNEEVVQEFLNWNELIVPAGTMDIRVHLIW